VTNDITRPYGLTELQEFIQERDAEQSEKQEEEEKIGPCRGKLEKTLKTHTKIHCLTSTSTNVWGGTEDGSIYVWDLSGGEVIVQEKLFNLSLVQMISVEDEVWILSGTKEINILKLNIKLQRKKSEPIDKKYVEIVKTLVAEDFEMGCLTKFDDKQIYAGTSIVNNTITIYNWTTKPPYNRKKDILQVPEVYDNITKQCNNEPITKMLFSKDNLFLAIHRFVFVFAKQPHHFQGVLDDHKNHITSMVEAQGKLWTASRDASIRQWEIKEDKRVCLSSLENAHEEQVTCLAVAGNLQVISGGADSKIKRRSAKVQLSRDKEIEFQSNHENQIECIYWACGKSKYLWVASVDKSITIWS